MSPHTSASASPRIVIVGAGHAGGTAAALLRQYGFEGSIALIGDEPIPPYQRPPLSKAWLKGEADEEALTLKPAAWYAENGVDLWLSAPVVAIDRADKAVVLAEGERLAYDQLIIATGARARRLDVRGASLSGVLFLRTAADAERLKAALGPGKRMVVVGGGYVGLEAAASARALGAEVTVIERESRVLARVAGETLSAFFQQFHSERGVRFVMNDRVSAFEGQGGRLTGVRLAGGEILPCDVALVGIGAVPNVELAGGCGLALADGIVVDSEARTSDPAIYAIGDCTWRPLTLYGREARLESVPNALEQAKAAASAIAGRAPPPPEVPWFWSDQYDLKLQMAGLAFDADQTILRGDIAAGRFAVFHLRNGVLIAVEAVNAPAEFMGGRLMIGRQARVDAARLADPAISMKEVAA
jgi:3-phenylpropionate/trans-cinnamate dioxygenase ferredoxin reductase subunit